MKTISKIFALVLALTMLMSVVAFASTKTLVTGTSGNSITFSYSCTTDYEGKVPLETDVKANDIFYVWVDFSNNPSPADNSMQMFNLVFEYDTTQIDMSSEYLMCEGLAAPQVSGNFAPGVCYAVGTKDGGFTNRGSVIASGKLFGLELKALKDIALADASKVITMVTSGTSASTGTVQTTKVEDGQIPAKTLSIVVPEEEEEKEPVPVKKAVTPEALTTLVAEDANYTNVAIWKATFSGLQTKGATNIGYDFTKTGSDKNNGKVITTEISGDGDVVFVLALHGVSADEYGKLTFAPYYTVMEVPAN